MIFYKGQRWTSESEPELGLGSVLCVSAHTVTVEFDACKETREYACDNAPLLRTSFRPGDKILSRDGEHLTVESVTKKGNLLHYHGGGQAWCETELSSSISINKPEERLLAGQLDSLEAFELRVSALEQQHQRRKSPVRGFTGGRIDLLPHQLYLASEVAGRLVPRVLLADEVGLGKTIETCLILHRLLLTGRAQRVLVLVPDSLVHQWFVELLRRFHLWFHIFDEERCEALEAVDPDTNPFLDDQLVISKIGLLSNDGKRLQQALAAGWDVVVVDEAHHLGWSEEVISREYATVAALARQSPGLLLLTATPEQLGIGSHFARLQLLDPERFHNLEEFVKETGHYREVAELADRLQAHQTLSRTERSMLSHILQESEVSVASRLSKVAEGVEPSLRQLIGALLDYHGTGRVMFRNTRNTVSGFPGRTAHLCPLPVPDTSRSSTSSVPRGAEKLFEALADEFAADTNPTVARTFRPDFSRDPRIGWLAALLRSLALEKVLLICRTQAKVEAIEAALRQQINVKIGVFHEGLPLVKRDRNAAWFAEEDGARILVCSEIGSEGRNFQFSHHLVLFDLPLDPELLEQRLGRLDRIGQTSPIQVHVPFVAGSPQEVLARWYHEGLDSLQTNLHGGRELRERFGARLHDLAQDFHETEETSRADLESLIEETRSARKELAVQLEQGRDRLLELNSFHPAAGARLVEEIQRRDLDLALDQFMLAVFDHYSIQVEEVGPRTYRLGSAGVFADVFPGLPTEGLTVTCDRARALAREDIQFLTWDHPLVTGALDLLLGSEQGNSNFAHWLDPKVTALYLEMVYLLECVAPPGLHVDRFLPSTPVRVLVDQHGNDVGESIPPAALRQHLGKGNPQVLWSLPGLREELLPALLERAQGFAANKAPEIVAGAQYQMSTQLDAEIRRLQELQKLNRSVRDEEIALLVEQRKALAHHIAGARLRLDAIRFIQRGPRTAATPGSR